MYSSIRQLVAVPFRSRASSLFFAVSSIAVVSYFLASGDLQLLLYDGIGFFAVGSVVAGIVIHRPAAALIWYLIAFGLTLMTAGDLIGNLVSISGGELPYPSISDAFYFVGNLSIVLACGLVIRRRNTYRDIGGFIDATILATTATLLIWTLMIQPYANDPSLTLLQRLVSLSYPALDVIMAGVGVRLLLTGGRQSPSFYFITLALAAALVGDITYAELTLEGTYYPGHPIDLAYLLWYLFWGAAALHPSMRMVTDGVDEPNIHTSRRRVTGLTAAVLLVPLVMLYHWWRNEPYEVPVFVGGSSLLFLLVLWRMLDSIRMAERAFAERQRVLDRERVLRDVASGLAAAWERREAFAAVTGSLEAFAADRMTSRVLLMRDGVASLVSAGGAEIAAKPDGPFAADLIWRANRSASGMGLCDESTVIELKKQLSIPARYAQCGVHIEALGPEEHVALVLAGDGLAPDELTDLLGGVGTQLAQAIARITLAEDVSQRKNQEVFHSLVRNSSDVTMIVEVDGTLRYVSPASQATLGASPAELIGTNLTSSIHPDDRAAAEAFLSDITHRPERVLTTHFRLQGARHRWLYVEAVGNNLVADPDVNGLVLNVHDITERRRAEELLEFQAFHDGLTTLPNRALFLDRLTSELERRHGTGGGVPVLFIDLDRFKFVNDSFGHEGGDQLLIVASQRIRQVVSEADIVARLGGDEFTVILCDPETRAHPAVVAARLVAQLSRPYEILGRATTITVSVGIAISQSHHERADDLLRDADTAMYHVKERGRNGYAVFDDRMGTLLASRISMESDLERALARREFVLHYQPEIDLETGDVVSLEALIRWQHPVRGLVYPAEFVPLAEESGLIVPIGRWVLEEACRQAKEWGDRFPDRQTIMSVNLSARQLLDPDLANDVCTMLRNIGLPGSLLRIEITESTLMEDREPAIDVLASLRACGVQIAVDDFGSGYSSLGYLKYFPIDVLKLDRSFIGDSQRPQQDDAIIQAVTTLAHGLGISITIEGVETQEQLARVHSMGCDRGQGYLFARPVDATSVPELLATRSFSQFAP